MKKKLQWYICALLLLATASVAYGQTATFSFGGFLVTSITCNEGTLLMTAYDWNLKTPITLLFDPKISRINLWGNLITPGVHILGTAFYGGICTIGNTVIVPFGTISGPAPAFPGIGTSLTP